MRVAIIDVPIIQNGIDQDQRLQTVLTTLFSQPDIQQVIIK